MDQVASDILNIIRDYHNHLGFFMDVDHILKWVRQFEEQDQSFVLEEFLHILNNGIYISRLKGSEILLHKVQNFATLYGFSSEADFLRHAHFLKLQASHKSQPMLLEVLNEQLQEHYGMNIDDCGTDSRRHCFYIDDILATGGTLYTDLIKWLPTSNSSGNSNLGQIIDGTMTFRGLFYCLHNGNTTLWRLRTTLEEEKLLKKLPLSFNYEVQNHLTFLNQSYNFAYPVQDQPLDVITYFENLPENAVKHAAKAFRTPTRPIREVFFSSATNRVRFENIFLKTGVRLLNAATHLKANHRPLGATFPSYRTLGTGTIFFTWRNVSNTCPIAFWWQSAGWDPLFPLDHRGLAM